MPGGELPFKLPLVPRAPTLAFAPELVLFDREILRKPTSRTDAYAGTPVPYVRPASLAHVTARLDDSPGSIALFVNRGSSAIDTVHVLADLGARVALAVDVEYAPRGQLPYLFGITDPSVRDRLTIDLAEDEVTIDEVSSFDRDKLVTTIDSAVTALRARSTVGVEARVGVHAGTTNHRLALLLDALGRAKVESVHLVPIQDSGVTSSTSYAERRGSVPSIRLGQPNAMGDLEKPIIRRYIKRNVAKLVYCYEKELLASPELAGTVNTQFFIAPTGAVSSIAANGVSSKVAACIARVIREIEFPKPKDGGGVQVNFPFTFRPNGG